MINFRLRTTTGEAMASWLGSPPVTVADAHLDTSSSQTFGLDAVIERSLRSATSQARVWAYNMSARIHDSKLTTII